MFDSDEEFEASTGQGPSKLVADFVAGLPEHLRENAAPLTNFTHAGFIARGSFGQVYKAINPDGHPVALKKLSLHQFDNRRHQIARKDSFREIKVLASLKHRNVAQLLRVVLGSSDVYLAVELCPVQVLSVAKHNLPMPIVKSITWQLMTGLKYIHACGLIHRDIKIDNLMLKEGVLKIGDFGSTASVKEEVWTPQVVTLWYRPPEILLGCPHQTCAVDVWSAGCVMAELFLGRPLFGGFSELNQINLIVDMLGTPTEEDWPGLNRLPVMECMELNQRDRRFTDELAPVTSKAARKLLAGMLVYNPESRLSAANCLGENYFVEQPEMATESEVAKFCDSVGVAQQLSGFRQYASNDANDNSENISGPDEKNSEKLEKVRKKLRLDL
ncbi:cyclin-dependent kinase 11A-like [Tropilaelaps mercedesae]|uniref:Cyclin-dependent kinase 11A-like n=1 Tax=Tropilaelaps mercedesae TaxID=418985 RepID=A0A1V9XAP3_9ACAR|nr:cyclin-dependent kinase 11A-like [Tropilaelaps mercedesae]